MRSYLKFLSRNKMYTAIEAAGLVVSLAVVVMISCFVHQQYSITRESPGYERSFVLNMGDEYLNSNPGEMSIVQDRVPDVECAARMDVTIYGVRFADKIIQSSPHTCSVDPEFFEFFPVDFISGSEEVLKDRSQVILGESFANKLSPDADPVGQRIIIGKDTCVIGGILRPRHRSIIKESDIYRSFQKPDAPSTEKWFHPYSMVLVRLRQGADKEAARELIDTVVQREFAEYYSNRKPENRMTLPMKELYFSSRNHGGDVHKGNLSLVHILIAIGILLLVSALFNYINLSVALAGKRAKEMAIRSTLGESRHHVAGRYVIEAVCFVAVCLALALLVAKWLEPVFNRYVAGDLGLDMAYSVPYIVAYALLALVVGAVSGLIPAWMSLSSDPVSIIKGEQRRQTKAVFSKVFIVLQNVITVALISMALVMELQYNHLVNMPLGANVDNLYYATTGPTGVNEFAAMPAVSRIGKSNGFPGKRSIGLSTTVEGQKFDIGVLNCDETAFEIYGFEKIRDYHRPLGGSFWFTESAARAFSVDEEDPKIPDALKYFYDDVEIGGIIKDFAIKGPSKVDGNQIGLVQVSKLEGQATYILELNRTDPQTLAAIDKVIRDESLRKKGDESLLDSYGFIPSLIEKDMTEDRNFIGLIELFMLLAAIISLLGLVAMSTYYAGLQTRDIAVRKVFGGTVRSETWHSVKEYMILVGIAILVGIPIAVYFAGRYLERFWYRIEGYGWVFAVAAVIALVVSFAAVLWQTLSAARTNPATELKKE